MKRRQIMKFMAIFQVKDSFYALSPEKQKEMMDVAGQQTEKATKEGKLKEMYYLGNMKGVMAVFDLNSEDLVRLPYESPMFPFMDVEITPLVDMEVVRRVQAKK
jgi:muconolactone delta-isomerase